MTLKSFRARFAAPVRPGDELMTNVWFLDQEGNGRMRVRFSTTVNGSVVLKDGDAVVVLEEQRREMAVLVSKM